MTRQEGEPVHDGVTKPERRDLVRLSKRTGSAMLCQMLSCVSRGQARRRRPRVGLASRRRTLGPREIRDEHVELGEAPPEGLSAHFGFVPRDNSTPHNPPACRTSVTVASCRQSAKMQMGAPGFGDSLAFSEPQGTPIVKAALIAIVAGKLGPHRLVPPITYFSDRARLRSVRYRPPDEYGGSPVCHRRLPLELSPGDR